MDKFAKIPIWVVVVFALAATGVCACLELEPFTSAIILTPVVIVLLPKTPVWVVVSISSIAAVFCAFCDFRILRPLAVLAVFMVLSCKLVNLLLVLARILGAKLSDKRVKGTEQYEGDDPDGLGTPYIWSGRPPESEKGKKSSESDWLL